MKRLYIIASLFLIFLSGCSNSMNDKEQAKDITEKENNDEKSLEMKLYIDDAEVPVTWEDNDSVKAIMEMI